MFGNSNRNKARNTGGIWQCRPKRAAFPHGAKVGHWDRLGAAKANAHVANDIAKYSSNFGKICKKYPALYLTLFSLVVIIFAYFITNANLKQTILARAKSIS